MAALLRMRRGFTILEMIIAAAIFAVAVVCLIGVFPVSARAAREAQGTLVAVNLAQRELEMARSASYSAITPRTSSYTISIDSNGVDERVTFSTSLEVTEVRPGLKLVKATVTWAQPDSVERSTSLETYVVRLTP